jgi:hypothetical protein
LSHTSSPSFPLCNPQEEDYQNGLPYTYEWPQLYRVLVKLNSNSVVLCCEPQQCHCKCKYGVLDSLPIIKQRWMQGVFGQRQGTDNCHESSSFHI